MEFVVACARVCKGESMALATAGQISNFCIPIRRKLSLRTRLNHSQIKAIAARSIAPSTVIVPFEILICQIAKTH